MITDTLTHRQNFNILTQPVPCTGLGKNLFLILNITLLGGVMTHRVMWRIVEGGRKFREQIRQKRCVIFKDECTFYGYT